MKVFVLDNSVAMRWLLASEKEPDQRYAEVVLRSLVGADARVPNLWHLEATNVLLNAEKRSEVSAGEVERFMAQLENLLTRGDTLTVQQAFGRIMTLSRICGLSSYDAACLELAIREGISLATLAKGLIEAANRADVELYLR